MPRPGHDGKRKYKTQAQAREAAREFLESRGQRLSPYHCRYCNQYHLGHRSRAERPTTLEAAVAMALRKKESV